MQKGVTQISVRESVRARFQPDNNSVKLAESANSWMVDVIIDDVGRNDEVERGVGAVDKGHNGPNQFETTPGGRLLLWYIVVLSSLLHPRQSGLCLLGSSELNKVCNKEMARDRQVEEQSVYDVLTTVVVA